MRKQETAGSIIGEELSALRMQLLIRAPFYGDVCSCLVFRESAEIPVAATDGVCVLYNPEGMSSYGASQRAFIFLHEIMHILLDHNARRQNRDPQLWNIACDYVINQWLEEKRTLFPVAIDPPPDMLKSSIGSRSAEEVYDFLKTRNQGRQDGDSFLLPDRIRGWGAEEVIRKMVPEKLWDLQEPQDPQGSGDSLSRAMHTAQLEEVRREVNAARKKMRGFGGGGIYQLPEEILLPGARLLPWRSLLSDFLTEIESDEASYATPERKYLHMDLILPGHSFTDTELEDVWAFVDSSGSISEQEMRLFLTQLYHLVKGFSCVLNIAFWETRVNAVYRDIRKEQDVLESLPKSTGGTDINCVYQWMEENRVRPGVLLILTDGYFGDLDERFRSAALRRKTILVLSGYPEPEKLKYIGRIAGLEEKK